MRLGPIDPHLFNHLVDDPRTRGDGDRPDCFLCGRPIVYHLSRGLKVGHTTRDFQHGEEPEFTSLPLWCHTECGSGLTGEQLAIRYQKALDAVMRGGAER